MIAEPPSFSTTSSRMLRLILLGCQAPGPQRLKPRFFPGALSARVELVPFPACALDPQLPADFVLRRRPSAERCCFLFGPSQVLRSWLCLPLGLEFAGPAPDGRSNEIPARSLRALEKARAFGMTPSNRYAHDGVIPKSPRFHQRGAGSGEGRFCSRRCSFVTDRERSWLIQGRRRCALDPSAPWRKRARSG